MLCNTATSRTAFYLFVIASLAPAVGAERPSDAEIDATCGDINDTSTAHGVCRDEIYLKKLESELNTLYKVLLNAQGRDDSIRQSRQLLILAERAWVAFRDKECALAQSMYGGVSDANKVRCLVDLTEKRLADLRRYGEYFGVVSPNTSLERP